MKRLLMLTLMCVLATVWISQPAVAAEKLVRVAPKTINFGTVPVGTEVLKGATITNVSDSDVLLLVEGTRMPDDFSFGLMPGSTCPALAPDILPAGASCDVVVRFRPTEFFAGQRQTAELTATLRDPTTGALLATISIPVIGRGVSTA